MRNPKTHYDTLEVNKSANDAEIKAAYYRLAKIYHPDSGEENQENAETFLKIQKAYDVLSSPLDKRDYDRKLNIHQPTQSRTYTAPPEPAPAPEYEYEQPNPGFQWKIPLNKRTILGILTLLIYQLIVGTASFCCSAILTYFLYGEQVFIFADRTILVICMGVLICVSIFSWTYKIRFLFQSNMIGYYAIVCITFVLFTLETPVEAPEETIALLAFALIAGTIGNIMHEQE